MKLIKETPYKELDRATDKGVRHKSGATPSDYLYAYLPITRQFGYATQDDSWGEFEKELAIALHNSERRRRAIEFIVDSLGIDEDDLLDMGENHWFDEQARKSRMAEFLERVRKVAA